MVHVIITDKKRRGIYITDGLYPADIPKYIIDKFIRTVTFMEEMPDIRDIYNYPGFDSKKKQGKFKDHRGIRLNDQRRLLFYQDKSTSPITIYIDYVDNAHYK